MERISSSSYILRRHTIGWINTFWLLFFVKWALRKGGLVGLLDVSRFSSFSPGEWLSKSGVSYGTRDSTGLSFFPLLFNIVAQAFLILVIQFQERRWLEGIVIHGLNDRIIVLQYTDDTILFLRYIEGLVDKVQSCRIIFSLISRFRINL